MRPSKLHLRKKLRFVLLKQNSLHHLLPHRHLLESLQLRRNPNKSRTNLRLSLSQQKISFQGFPTFLTWI
jgi:hypothetical protein